MRGGGGGGGGKEGIIFHPLTSPLSLLDEVINQYMLEMKKNASINFTPLSS